MLSFTYDPNVKFVVFDVQVSLSDQTYKVEIEVSVYKAAV